MDPNPALQATFVRLEREIAGHDRQIAEHQTERAIKSEALAHLKDHAPKPAPAQPAE